MWNWLLSSLAVGATVVLYDGNPMYPDVGAMWKLIQDEKITIFGLSASYINICAVRGLEPGKSYDLSSLRENLADGIPFSAEGFEYVYRRDQEGSSISIPSPEARISMGVSAIGSPTQPVYAGELQAPGLGMKTSAI